MRTSDIHGWIELLHDACPPGRTPTPSIPRR
jgi:hypothetical protein